MRLSRPISLLAALWLTACATARFDQPSADMADYAAKHPYYAEFCALSQIKKQPDSGADIRGEIGGHAVFYLNGACLVRDAHYPLLEVCDGGGAGLSMNAHFRNAKWIATPGRDFFFYGNLSPSSAVSQDSYRQVQREAQRLGIYDGVEFHDEVFDAMPPGWSRADWKYEVSVATDYAIGLGRGRYCALVPVDRAAMERMVAFLNAENAPYRAGAEFRWSVFQDNCIHLAHNALAAAGLWDVWPINRFILFAIFDFPVPKNEFVNLMRQTNDTLPRDPGQLYHDVLARQALLDYGELPTRPGALAEARPPLRPNAVYDTELKLIFYDDPLLGAYQGRFDQVFNQPRYTDPAANRRYFAAESRRAVAARQSLSWWLAQQPFARDPEGFTLVYQRFYALMDQWAAEDG